MSDFLTPRFYDPVQTPGTRYSLTGAIKAPRQILRGGYISWVNQLIDEMQQLLWVDPNSPPTIRNLGPVPQGMSLRAWVDGQVSKSLGKLTVRNPKKKLPITASAKRNKAKRVALDSIADARAKLY